MQQGFKIPADVVPGAFPERIEGGRPVRTSRRLTRTKLARTMAVDGTPDTTVLSERGSRFAPGFWGGGLMMFLFAGISATPHFGLAAGADFVLVLGGCGVALTAIGFMMSRRRRSAAFSAQKIVLTDGVGVFKTSSEHSIDSVVVMKHFVKLYSSWGYQPDVSRHALVLHTPGGIWAALVLSEEEHEIEMYLRNLDAGVQSRYAGWGAVLLGDY